VTAPVYNVKLADIYDAIYHFKDYESDARQVADVIRRFAPDAHTLLETACGTGRFLQHLSDQFDVQGLDLSGEMLARAAARVPGVALHTADMCRFDLGKSYDAVCCLFRSIAYTRTVEGFRQSVQCMAAHLNRGGVLLIEPFFAPENFHVGKVTLNEYSSEALKVAWMYTSERRGTVGVFETHYLVGTAHGVKHFTERHELGLFSPQDYDSAFAAAGLRTIRHDDGPGATGLYIGVRD
jgi:ubiquinone/menaquinone biosynthesis C-methylase UbiE